jgi:competence protein ComEA
MNGSDRMRAWRGYIALSLAWLVILAAVLLWLWARRPPSRSIEILPPPTALPTQAPLPTPSPAPFHVDVAGAVKAPGVYRLPPGSIVADAIALAGGPSADADLDRLNKAVDLQDGSQVYVPRRSETRSSPPDPAVSALVTSVPPVRAPTSGTLIDLNTATPEELDKLPGIGPALAQRVVEGRPYGAIEELLRVKGIGPAVYDEIKDLITVR